MNIDDIISQTKESTAKNKLFYLKNNEKVMSSQLNKSNSP